MVGGQLLSRNNWTTAFREWVGKERRKGQSPNDYLPRRLAVRLSARLHECLGRRAAPLISTHCRCIAVTGRRHAEKRSAGMESVRGGGREREGWGWSGRAGQGMVARP